MDIYPSPEPPPPPNLPPELYLHPDYEVEKELGRGGMGIVFLAWHRLMGRREVLKVMNQALLDKPGAVERFLREIRLAAALDHENVVKAYGAMRLGGLLIFSMEYVDGENLADLVTRKGPLPVAAACSSIRQAAFGLQHAFERGMVHRDIKPHNLILSNAGSGKVVKLLDFGLAKASRAEGTYYELTPQGQMLGTPAYVAPEQIEDATTADVRSDIYSLGCTLYFLLAGRPPFEGKSLYAILNGHLTQEAAPLTAARTDVPAALNRIVAQMMAKEPHRRYATPAEVALALAPFVEDSGRKSPAPPRPSAEGSPGQRPAKPRAEERSPSRKPLVPKAPEVSPPLPAAPALMSERGGGVDSRFRRIEVLIAAALLLIVGGLGAVWLVGLRDRERRTQCESNLRQFYTGLKAYSESDPEGRFPQVAAQGPTSIAGIFVPLLRDKELLPPGQPGECCDLPEKSRPRTVEELRLLYSERPEEFAQAARTLGGCYAYTLGYRDGDAHRGLKKDMPEGLPLMSDRPPTPTAPEFHSGGNSPNHGGKGQNVLTLGGVVTFHTTRAAGIQGDDIFTNRDRLVAAGLDRHDSVLGRSDARPYQSGRDE